MKEVASYISWVDSKERLKLFNPQFYLYLVTEYEDGRIILEPKCLDDDLQKPSDTVIRMIDSAMKNIKECKVSEYIDLTKIAKEIKKDTNKQGGR